MNKTIWMALVAIVLVSPAWTQFWQDLPEKAENTGVPKVGLRVISNLVTVKPGHGVNIAVEITIPDGWVYYGPVQKPSTVIPCELSVKPGKMDLNELRYPKPHFKPTEWGQDVLDIPVYTGKVVFFAVLTAPADASTGSKLEITLEPQGQICKDVCIFIPVKPVACEISVGAENVANPAWPSELDTFFADSFVTAQLAINGDANKEEFRISGQSDYTLIGALWVAIAAGLLLNVMPCVLPVLPLRILSVVQMAEGSRRRYVTMGIAFAGGVMAFFACVAVLNVILKLTVGRAFDLNEGYQSPVVISGLCAILVLLAMNLFGVFDVVVPSGVSSVENRVEGAKSGHLKSLGMGFMMAVLGTPCSFAFLAAAVAYAQTATLLNGTLVILAIGAGMALPHFILAAFPSLVKVLPKPGRWMELFRQGCGFAVLGAVVWLLSTMSNSEDHREFRLMGWLVVLCIGSWIWGKFMRYDDSRRKKMTVRFLMVTIVVIAGLWLLVGRSGAIAKGKPFDAAAIDSARRDGKTVVVRFTASWCIKCIELERGVYEDKAVINTLESGKNVEYFVGDVTTADMPAAIWMKKHGFGSGVPLTVIYKPGATPKAVVGGYSTQEFLGWINGG